MDNKKSTHKQEEEASHSDRSRRVESNVFNGRLCYVAMAVVCALLLPAQTAAQNSTVPYIAGVWNMEYTYNEMLGPRDNIVANPCSGPFPYRYSWEVYIWQLVETVNGTRRTTGQIRACWYQREECQTSAKIWNIERGTKTVISNKCRFQPKDEHPFDIAQHPGYMAGGYMTELKPTDKNGNQMNSKLWSQYHVPESQPYVWGSFCEQFSWYDRDLDEKLAPPYAGSWRYDNETWVILRDISTCPCFPQCQECEERVPNTKFKQVKDDGGACLAKYKTRPSQCQYVIVGVSGGPAQFSPLTTPYPLDDFGEAQVCFSYNNIKGTRVRGPEGLPEIRSEDWGTIGVASLNRNPEV